MRLSEYVRPDFVLTDLDAAAVEALVHAVAERAASIGIGDGAIIEEKLLERERVHPTVIGEGLAIPHATVPGLDGPVIGVALPREPIQPTQPDADPVQAYFVLLSPPGSERLHVKLLARVCRLVRHGDLIPRLKGVTAPDDALQIIENEDALHP